MDISSKLRNLLTIVVVLLVGFFAFNTYIYKAKQAPEGIPLESKIWTWESALYNDGTKVTPRDPGVFTITFDGAGSFALTTDCNQMGGSYEEDGNSILFLDGYRTKMFCENSQESEFLSLLVNASSYHFGPSGELILDLKFDDGSVRFY